MNRSTRVSRMQLALSLEPEAKHPLSDLAREELLRTLAELLLEALGEERVSQASEQGVANESEDRQ